MSSLRTLFVPGCRLLCRLLLVLGGVLLTCASAGAARRPLYAIAGGPGDGVAVGRGALLFSSTTHQVWEEAAGADTSVTYTAVVRSVGGYIVGAADGSIWISSNLTGNSFILQGQPANRAIRAFALAGGNILAVGDQGLILRSTDLTGAVWIDQPTEGPVTADLRAVAWNGTSSVAAGLGGVILRAGGLGGTWSRAPLGESRDLFALAVNESNPGQFLAVGAGGAMWKGEPDGLTWSPLESPTTMTLRGAAVVGAAAVAVGDGGAIFFSPGDFLTWEDANSPVTVDLYSVAFTGQDLVACGDKGRVLWSYLGLQWGTPIVPVEESSWGSLKHRFLGR